MKQLTIETTQGTAIASQELPGGAWEVNHPWGAFYLYGATSAVRKALRERIKQCETAEA